MPYAVGLQSAAHAFLSAGFATQFTLAVIAFLVIVFVTSALQKEGVDAPKFLPGYSIFHIIPFFRRRHDFLNWGFHATGQNVFQFMLLRVRLCSLPLFHGPVADLRCIPEYGGGSFRRDRETNFLHCQGSGSNRRFQDSVWSCRFFGLRVYFLL